ncbi:MAG: hypothetical protein AAFY58_06165, partial [Planctomycetota bacterium]
MRQPPAPILGCADRWSARPRGPVLAALCAALALLCLPGMTLAQAEPSGGRPAGGVLDTLSRRGDLTLRDATLEGAGADPRGAGDAHAPRRGVHLADELTDLRDAIGEIDHQDGAGGGQRPHL